MRIISFVFFLPFILNAEKKATYGGFQKDQDNRRYVDTRPSVSDEKKPKNVIKTLDSKIETANKNGQLSQEAYSNLKQKQVELKAFRSAVVVDGKVGAKEQQALTQLKQEQQKLIKSEVAKATANSEGSNNAKNKSAKTLKQRIEQAHKSGRLTDEEYAKLMAQHAELAAFRGGAKADGKVNAEERKAINEERKELRKEIKEEANDGDFEPEKQLANFTARVVDGVVQKKLTSEEFTNIDNKITAAKANLEAARADGNMDAAEEAALAQEFMEISRLIYGEKHDKEKNKFGYAVSSQDLYQQISDSIKAEQGQ